MLSKKDATIIMDTKSYCGRNTEIKEIDGLMLKYLIYQDEALRYEKILQKC